MAIVRTNTIEEKEMCLIGYPSHSIFNYFGGGKQKNSSRDEIKLASDYEKDMELSESIFQRLLLEQHISQKNSVKE
jgi:hypothetical protein